MTHSYKVVEKLEIPWTYQNSYSCRNMLPSHLHVFSDATMIMFKKTKQPNNLRDNILSFCLVGDSRGKQTKPQNKAKKPHQNKQTKTQ